VKAIIPKKNIFLMVITQRIILFDNKNCESSNQMINGGANGGFYTNAMASSYLVVPFLLLLITEKKTCAISI
jgi:hypothetical protein